MNDFLAGGVTLTGGPVLEAHIIRKAENQGAGEMLQWLITPAVFAGRACV